MRLACCLMDRVVVVVVGVVDGVEGETEFLQVGGQKKKMIWIPLCWCFCRNGG